MRNLHIYKTAAILLLFSNTGFSQCANEANIYSFQYNGHTYEVVRENKTWTDASICAVSRNGYLAEINDVTEQNEIFNQLTNNASINISNTQNQFGTASVWIGGSDAVTEGDWLWDGNNDGTGAQFWEGGPSGMPIGGLYTNWGISPAEPDNSGGQDRLTIIIKPTATNFGLWNDLISTNTIYYLIESDSGLGLLESENANNVTIYPNPINDYLQIESVSEIAMDFIEIYDYSGKKVLSSIVNETNGVNVSKLEHGNYLLMIHFEDGSLIRKKIIK